MDNGVSQTLNYPPSTNSARWLFNNFDYAWAEQILPSYTAPSIISNVSFLIAGMQNNSWTPGPNPTPNVDNVQPFIWDQDCGYDTVTGHIIPSTYTTWTHYLNQNGTGAFYTTPNCYQRLGDGLSNMAWNPVFAARANSYSDVLMSAPRWDPASSFLNLKVMDVEGYHFTEGSCSGSYQQYYKNDSSLGVTTSVHGLGGGMFSVGSSFGSFPAVVASASTHRYTPSYTTSLCSGSNIQYKQNNGINKNEETEISILPNPAINDIKISFGKDMSDKAQVAIRLYNIYGQCLSQLYSGSVGDSEGKSFMLPDVAPGIYMVQVFDGSKLLCSRKLSILK